MKQGCQSIKEGTGTGKTTARNPSMHEKSAGGTHGQYQQTRLEKTGKERTR